MANDIFRIQQRMVLFSAATNGIMLKRRNAYSLSYLSQAVRHFIYYEIKIRTASNAESFEK